MCLLSVNSAVSFVTNLRMLCVLSHDTYGLLFAIIVEDAKKETAESTDMCLLSVNSAVSFVTNLRMLCVLSHDTYGLLFAIIVEDAKSTTAESTDMCLLSVNSAVSFVTNLRMLCVLSHDTYGLLFAIIVEDAKSTDIMKSIFTSLMISCLSYSHKPPYGIFFSFFLFCRFPGNFLAFFLCLSPSPGFSSLFSDSSCC